MATAVQEAWEEAGIRGVLHDRPLGCFQISKRRRELTVLGYLMHVYQVEDFWPEAHRRLRTWETATKTACLLSRPVFQELFTVAQEKLPDALDEETQSA